MPATIKSLVEMLAAVTAGDPVLARLFVDLAASAPDLPDRSLSANFLTILSPTKLAINPKSRTHKPITGQVRFLGDGADGSGGAGSVSSVGQPQWGQSTEVPMASAGNSMCLPHCWHEHLRYLMALMSIGSQRLQHRLDARHFVGAEQIRLAQRGEDGEKRFGAADLFPEIFEGMRQRLADRIAQRAQPEAVQERRHLVAHASGAVLQVPVIETETRIAQDFPHALPMSDFDLALEVVAPLGRGV